MASAPSDPGTVTGRVDAAGRLVAADGPLAALQVEAGSALGARLALPQIAAVARLARALGVPIARSVLAAGAASDYDLWVRAVLDGDEVALSIDGWRPRQPVAPRLDLILAADDDRVARDPATGEWATDAELKLTVIAPDLAERLHVAPADAMGQPLNRLLKLEEEEDGSLPLLTGLAARLAFTSQKATARTAEATPLLLSGEVLRDDAGDFAGFTGRAVPAAPALSVIGSAASSPGEGLDADLDRALRSPLDRIIAAADKIVERSDGPLRSDYAGYASDIAAAGRHLLSVLQAMGEGVVPDTNRVDLVSAATEAISLVAATGREKRITVDVMAPSRIEALGNPRSVVQIIVNILGNAIRHSPVDGTVTISIVTSDGRARLTVADRGPGIALADQVRIFERFERLEAEETGGTGLGLAIARRLAQSMDGSISLDSAPGAGARFTLDLPAA